MTLTSLVKVLALLVAAVLFLIAAFVDDPRTELGLGLCLVAVARGQTVGAILVGIALVAAALVVAIRWRGGRG